MCQDEINKTLESDLPFLLANGRCGIEQCAATHEQENLHFYLSVVKFGLFAYPV